MSRHRVLYIAGSGRSGTTLVASILGQLDGFFAAGELRYLWQRGLVENRPCGCGALFRECPLWSDVAAEVNGADPPDPALVARRLRERLRMLRVPDLLLRRRSRHSRLVPPHPDDAAIERLYAALAERTDARVIVDSSKLPPYGAMLQGLSTVELYVLHLLRDPRATAFSWQRRRDLDDGADGQMDVQPAWKASLLWLVWNTVSERLWARSSTRYLRIRYEDFIADPATTTARIVDFVGEQPAPLPFSGAGDVQLQPTHTVAGNPSRHRTGPIPLRLDSEWVDAMPSRSRLLVTMLTGPALLHFGYPPRVRRRNHSRDTGGH